MTILGHILSLVGCLFMVGIGLLKSKKHMLVGQCAQFALQAGGNVLLGSVSGCVAGVVSIVRILVFTGVKKVSVWLKVGFIALQAVLTWYFGAQTLVQWLPVLAMIPYTWFLDTEDAVLFKVVNLLGVGMWLIHDVWYGIYFSVVFDVLTIVSTVVGIVTLMRDRRTGKGSSGNGEAE